MIGCVSGDVINLVRHHSTECPADGRRIRLRAEHLHDPIAIDAEEWKDVPVGNGRISERRDSRLHYGC